MRALPDPSDCQGLLVRKFYCEGCGLWRPVQIACGDRCCPTCRKRAYKRLLARYSTRTAHLPKENLSLLTLTLRIRPGVNLQTQARRIRRAFVKLMRQAKMKRCVAGGLYGLEALLQEGPRGTWNVHLHALVLTHRPVSRWFSEADGRWHSDWYDGRGGKIRPQDLGALWLALTGDSFVVDITPIRDSLGAVSEVVKYLGKGVNLPAEGPWRRDYNEAFSGSRLVQPFGCFHKASKAYEFETEDEVWAEERPVFRCPNCGCTRWIHEYELRRLEWAAKKRPSWKPWLENPDAAGRNAAS